MMLCLSLLIGVCAYAQSKFQKGYIITNNGSKTVCYIQNEDWKNNPSNFKYKINEDSSVLTGNLANIKEFSIDGKSKYQNYLVGIDRSSKRENELSTKRTPEFKSEALFLKVLIEGEKANLYSYTNGSLIRYFYSTPSKKVTQLVYKYYRTEKGRIGKNESYKRQLKGNLSCSGIKTEPSYTKGSLTKYFIALNKCNSSNSSLTNYTLGETKGKFQLKIKGGVNMHSAEITNLQLAIIGSKTAETESNINARFGVELEYLLPFNNNRWSIFLEPTYQSFNDDATFSERTGVVTTLIYPIDYTSLELPIGIRFYIPLKNESKLFLNTGFALDFPMNSSVGNRELESGPSVIFGAGFEFLNKFSAEIRYNGSRQILNNQPGFETSYGGFAVNLGYIIF